MSDDGQLELPGLVPQLVRTDGAMVVAAKRTLAALETTGQLVERHAVLVQSVITLADAMDCAMAGRKASYAVAQNAKELREVMLVLDPPPEDPAEGAEARRLFAQFVEAVEGHANTGDAVT